MDSATTVQTSNDRTIETVGLLNHVWLNLLADGRLREEAELRYVSHMWDCSPYWYLWLKNRPGVYKLELQAAQISEGYDWLAEFVIKYYPSVDEESFNGLSFLEKICRRSELFETTPTEGISGCPCHGHCEEHDEDRFSDLKDGTGVPAIHYADMIPADFFFAGHLLLAYKAAMGCLIRLKTQSKWRIIVIKDFSLKDNEGNLIKTLRKGEIDRDFPGFDITEYLFRHLVKAWRLFGGYAVFEEHVWKGDGMRFESDGETLFTAPSPDIQRVIIQTELFCDNAKSLPPLANPDIRDMKN